MRLFYLWFLISSPLLAVSLQPEKKTASAGSVSDVFITGWPLPSDEIFTSNQPATWLGSDPVLGRMSCPSLSRLDLDLKQSEPLVLKSMTHSKDEKGRSVWSYQLRSGIFWWNGDPLVSKDVASFLETNLAQIVAEKGAEQWSTPKYKIQVDADKLLITWESSPVFGPYVVNGVPLWRVKDSSKSDERSGRLIKFECVGRFVPSYYQVAGQQRLKLTSNPSYQSEGVKTLWVNSPHSKSEKTGSIDFAFPSSATSSQSEVIKTIKPNAQDKSQSCPAFINLPTLSVIIWNTEKTPLLDKSIKSLLMKTPPRKALWQVGAASHGRLISSLIPYQHPGYNEQVDIKNSKPINLKSFAQHTKSKTVIRPIIFSSIRSEMGIVEKAVLDVYKTLGLDVQFQAEVDTNTVDGYFTGLFLPWPELNFINEFHSKSPKKANSIWKKTSNQLLDKALESYAQSLSYEKPNFDTLEKIHSYLYDLEIVTVLMQHSTCAKIQNLDVRSKIRTHNPDWFKDILQ